MDQLLRITGAVKRNSFLKGTEKLNYKEYWSKFIETSEEKH